MKIGKRKKETITENTMENTTENAAESTTENTPERTTKNTKKKRKKPWGQLGMALFIVAFTTYILLDTFVITRVETPAMDINPGQTVNPVPAPVVNDGDGDDVGNDGNAAGQPEAIVEFDRYEDENISITITEHREYETVIHVADVKLSSPQFLKTAFAKGAYGQNIKDHTSDTAESVNAIFAVNGDYYSVRETGFVLRNGQLFRSSSSGREDLVIYQDGSFEIISEDNSDAEQLLAAGAQQILCFGPGLIHGGQITVADKEEASNPRTAIGLIDPLHYVFVVTDGRTEESEGLRYYELAEFMMTLGVQEGYNLDGGGSSCMYLNGRTVNRMANEGEREVSDIVYIGY